MCTIFHMSLYAQAVRGKNASRTGVLLIPAIFAGVIGSLVAGVVMQRTGKYRGMTVKAQGGLVVGTVLNNVMVWLSDKWSLAGIVFGESPLRLGL